MPTIQPAAPLDPSLMGRPWPLAGIAVIDFSPLLPGGLAEREAVVLKIGGACCNVGVAQLARHGITPGMAARVFGEAGRFFARPAQETKKSAIEKSACRGGDLLLGGENFDPERRDRALCPDGDWL